ncbi:flavin reductase family protein [Agromyces bauzanensis]|uniref:Monooxygenase n=1 Tax=Agromyces bauzanensis TaxID=1308924 RepID=A0A917PB85_9MICO|nr:flavin reductase family protein [Agromyces bauzanensis]GGJ69632.1 monooxygenase [Agromyces bauzanensis]
MTDDTRQTESAVDDAARAVALKAVFRTHPASVTLITASTSTGPVGLTASSVASVALDPPSISFSVTRATGSAGGLLAADTMLVHFLADRHADLARVFAHSGAPRFTPEQGWTTLNTGEPLLADTRAAFRCRALHVVPVGSSSLVLAEVLDVIPGTPGDPLMYHDRRFHRFDPAAPDL